MIFYDFEVFKYDWLVVFINPETKDKTVICNSRTELQEYYEKFKNEIWVGFNSRHYDIYILKAILLGLNPKEVNDYIIVSGLDGWRFSSEFKKIQVNNYDIMNSVDRGLKYFEGSMCNSIEESNIPFNIERKLTSDEIEETIKYCTHDVEQTIELFIERKSDFDAQIGLLKMFSLPISDISKTKVQLSAKILDAKATEYEDEFNIDVPKILQIEKYKSVVEWYQDESNYNYLKSFNIDVAGVPHSFGWGGVHGAIDNYTGEGYFINMDVASLYPSLMINYNLLSRSCDPTKFKEIVDLRLKYKAEKNPLQAPLKIVINGTYGASKDRFNPLYDPLQANRVCVYGQLLLLDLIEHLEPYCKVIQSNTDGVLIKCKEDDFELIDDVAYSWEERTGLKLEFDEYVKVIQKDVNNYLIVNADGEYKSKGAYVKKLSRLDNDLAIVNKAVVDNLIKDISVEKTIKSCNILSEFQLVKKISSKYDGILLNGRELIQERCVRCFATKADGVSLYKKHASTGRIAKLEGTPQKCKLINTDVNDLNVPDWLDKDWYIQMAQKRVNDFKGKKEEEYADLFSAL